MTNKSLRDYINLIETAEQGVAEAMSQRNKDQGAIGHGLPWKSYDDLDQLAQDISDKILTITNIVKLNSMAHDSTIYNALERYFKKYGYPDNVFNRVASIVFKRLDNEGRRMTTDPRIQEQGVAEGSDDNDTAKAAYMYGLRHGREGVGNNMDRAQAEWGDNFKYYNAGFLKGRNEKAKSLKAVGQGYGNKQQGVAEAEKNPHTSALGKALHRDLSKEKKASPAQVEKNKARWAQRQADKEQGVAEGLFGVDDKIKGKIQNVVSDLSDIPGMWDHKAQTFTDTGMDKLKTVLKNNPKYIKYALNLTYKDYEAEGVAEEGYGTHPSQRVDPRTGKKYIPPKSPLGKGVAEGKK